MPKPSKQSVAAKARYAKYRKRNNTTVEVSYTVIYYKL